MREYPIVAVLWNDHTSFQREELPSEIEIRPTLTVGLLVKKTKKNLVIAYNIERYDDRDEADFIILFSSTVISTKEFGTIQIDKLRQKGAS